jgi:hypothetical protein
MSCRAIVDRCRAKVMSGKMLSGSCPPLLRFTGRRDVVYMKFILIKSDGNLISMKFPVFVEMP